MSCDMVQINRPVHSGNLDTILDYKAAWLPRALSFLASRTKHLLAWRPFTVAYNQSGCPLCGPNSDLFVLDVYVATGGSPSVGDQAFGGNITFPPVQRRVDHGMFPYGCS